MLCFIKVSENKWVNLMLVREWELIGDRIRITFVTGYHCDYPNGKAIEGRILSGVEASGKIS